MNAPLRRVAVAVMVLFGLLFLNLNYVQFLQGDYYRNHKLNNRVLVQEYQRQRGDIRVARDAVATSKDTGGELRFTRTYPEGPEYAHTVGYKSIYYGDTGIEAEYDETLSGEDPRLFVRRFTDIITGRRPVGGDVVLTLSEKAQKTGFRELGDNRGALVALDPRTGAVLAAVSTPSYNPNGLASHSAKTAKKTWNKYLQDPNKPMLNRALGEHYPPGSTFKSIVAAAALKSGYSPSTMIPAGPSYTPQQTTRTITNAHPSICPESQVTLEDALRESCNTGFAKLGVELGADQVKDTARGFGFEDEDLQIPLLVAASRTGEMSDEPTLAQSSIGQRDVRMTPLQGAMIAATVANGGVRMKPHLIKEVRGPAGGDILEAEDADELNRPIDGGAATALRGMMVRVVQAGTGTAAQINGVEVGGKTGTAENAQGARDHGWFIGFAIKDGEPVVAVAVFLENFGSGGSNRATQIAGSVMKTVLEERG
ncbi:MAG TPA: penicillin-binding protein 2 [Micromonosporaceae bacterium]|nr:penicillin-binding protein 2 [Micromonosporaceae bacterium]